MADLPPFRDRTLLDRALTHRSYINEHPDSKEHNERLEFLGDAILTFLSGEFLYNRYPQKPEGELTSLRAALVNETQLAEFAKQLDLGSHLKLGRGAEREGGRQNPNLLSSAFEAVIGAYFLDANSDIDRVRAYITPLFEAAVDGVVAATINFKSRFQAWALANFGKNPHYVTTAHAGPDHAKEWTVEARIGEERYGEGKGPRKPEAEKNAAKNALEQLGVL